MKNKPLFQTPVVGQFEFSLPILLSVPIAIGIVEAGMFHIFRLRKPGSKLFKLTHYPSRN